jgi:hypothetical protein
MGQRKMQQLAIGTSLPCVAVRPRAQSAVCAERCDFCRRSADAVCSMCTLEVCLRHGSYSRNDKVFCVLCRRHVEPRCLECNNAARYKCARCPQRLCVDCAVFCSTVHSQCERAPHCKDCAAHLFKTCDLCQGRVCETLLRHCYHCRAPVRTCTPCISSGANRCDVCSLISCARCLGAQCTVCTVKRCIRCHPSLVLPRCMALLCLQPVCALCTLVCKQCGAGSCANHTPPADGRCPACPSQK